MNTAACTSCRENWREGFTYVFFEVASPQLQCVLQMLQWVNFITLQFCINNLYATVIARFHPMVKLEFYNTLSNQWKSAGKSLFGASWKWKTTISLTPSVINSQCYQCLFIYCTTVGILWWWYTSRYSMMYFTKGDALKKFHERPSVPKSLVFNMRTRIIQAFEKKMIV